MKLITKEIEKHLAKAGAAGMKPICKFFLIPGGTWVITGREPDEPDVLWGICDLGVGCVEYGPVSLRELESLRGRVLGLRVERDLHFDPDKYTFEELLAKETLAGI